VSSSSPQSVAVSALSHPSGVNLDGVASGFSAYLRKKWWAFLLILVLTIGLAFINPIMGLAVLIIGTFFMKQLYENVLFQAFANTNHFSFARSGQIEASGLIFDIGNSRRFSDIVTGQYLQWPLLLFIYTYTIGYGRDSHTYNRAVMAIKFSVSLPAFVLRRHKFLGNLTDEGESLKKYSYSQKVNLEGDFNKHFEVYIRPNTQDNVLAILTPDVMNMLIGLDKYEVELTDSGTLYVYSHDLITKKQDLVDIYSIVEAIIPKLSRHANMQKELNTLATANQSTATPVTPA